MTASPASHRSFAASMTCDECPWRTDVATGRFPPERYESLASTSRQGLGPIFACHKTTEGDGEHACVGWLLVDGPENLSVRIASMSGEVDLAALRSRGPLFDSFGAMAEANGVSAGTVDDLGVRSDRRKRAESD